MTQAERYEWQEVYEQLLKVYDLKTADHIVAYAEKVARHMTIREGVTRAIEVVCLPEMG